MDKNKYTQNIQLSVMLQQSSDVEHKNLTSIHKYWKNKHIES